MKDSFTIRASSWSTLFDCAYRWEAEQLHGMRKPLSHAMVLGKALHKSTAAYDLGRVEHEPISVSSAADVFVDALWSPDEDVEQRTNELPLRRLESVGLRLNQRYCEEISVGRNYKAVELTAEPLDVEADNGVIVTLTGTLDRSRVKSDGDELGITDVKTGKRAVRSNGSAETKSHQFQLGVYELLAEHSLGETINLPAEIVGLKTTDGATIGIATVANARRGLVGTDNTTGLLDIAATMLKTGTFPPNPNSLFCHPDHCPRWEQCSYHG